MSSFLTLNKWIKATQRKLCNVTFFFYPHGELKCHNDVNISEKRNPKGHFVPSCVVMSRFLVTKSDWMDGHMEILDFCGPNDETGVKYESCMNSFCVSC